MTDEQEPPLPPEEETSLQEEEQKEDQDLAAEVEKLKNQLLRTLAEFENYRKRADREREETAKFAISNFSRDLLTVADNLRRALESIPEDHEKPEELLNSLLEGVQITENELLSAFKKHGIQKIDPLDQSFDHHLHQAMFEVENPDVHPGTIVHVMQPGYEISGRLLRPALVGVAKGKNSDGPLKPSEPPPI
jgi:molecular chaperone GrpE